MKILIDIPVYDPVLNALQQQSDLDIQVVPEPSVVSRELPPEMIQDCELLICTVPPLNHSQMRNLKMIQIASAGFTQLIGQGFPERGIHCCNALGVFDIPIAEWNISMMINLARDFKKMLANQDNKVWDRAAKFQTEIRGKVVGLWGYGGIGRETARLAKAMGMEVWVLNRSEIKPRENVFCVEGTGDYEGVLPNKVFSMDQKETFLKAVDFLIVAIPQTASTEGIIGEDELRLLKPSALLLNPARGPIVKEEALVRALKEKWFAGAALDTHYYYPLPPEHPLWSMENVIISPHISGSSSSPHFLQRIWEIFFENVKRIKSGKPLLNELSERDLN